jgi:hypothetical protein
VQFDVFALPGLSCVLDSSVVGKFWMSAVLPPAIVFLCGASFLLQVRRSKRETIILSKLSADAWKDAKRKYGVGSKTSESKTKWVYEPEHREDGNIVSGEWIMPSMLDGGTNEAELSAMKMGALLKKAREAGVLERALDALDGEDDPRSALIELLAEELTSTAATNEAADTPDSSRRSAAEEDPPSEEALLVKHAETIAQAQQSTIGWAFLLIFLVCAPHYHRTHARQGVGARKQRAVG